MNPSLKAYSMFFRDALRRLCTGSLRLLFRSPVSPERAPDAAGFIQRWLLLEPIGANGLTDSVVRAIVKKDYFPDQFAVIPRDGDKA